MKNRMKKRILKSIFSVITLLVVALTSCTDAWDSHYAQVNSRKSSLNLYQYMQSQPNLSRFTAMLKVVGYDSILSKPQTYTVWAPDNSALQSVNMNDTATITEIVKNHVNRFSTPTSNVDSKQVYMISKKFIELKRVGSNFTFGGIPLIADSSNVATANGILHCINGYVPYMTNIWEFIGKTPGLDSLKAYLYSQSLFKFDPIASVEIGTNANGLSVYDSVITFSNPVLDKIGRIYLEDSTYTALLPTNTAWTKLYNQIKSYYKTLPADGGTAKQRLNTQMAMVNSLIFKNSIADPFSIDSLISTTGNIFKKPGYLFAGATKYALSNGLAYTTDSIRIKASDSYQQSIKVEAENSSYGRAAYNSSLVVFSSLGSVFNDSISSTKYLYVEPTSIVTQSSVWFPIPNTLSGKYNIYCVFVPNKIVQPTTPKRAKVRFYLSYINNLGAKVDSAMIANDHTFATSQTIKSSTFFTTSSSAITKLFVTQITFPYCSLFGKGAATSSISVKLKVESATLIKESVTYDRNMRIDYVILEPVQ
jgi:Secreted and surface protein containing fasciclin-like repeats